MAKIKELSMSRGRKYTQDYQSISYHISITVEGNDIDDMRESALSALILLEIKEQEHCRDVIGAEEVIKEIKENNTTLPEKVMIPEIPNFDKKQPKTTKKIVANGKHKVAGKRCDRCQGFISWDGWSQGSLPIHVDVDGIIVGNGDCPKGG